MTDRELMEAIYSKVTGLDTQMDVLGTKMEEFDTRIEGLDIQMKELNEKVEKLDQRVGELDQKVGELDQKVEGLDLRVIALETRWDKLDRGIQEINLHLENKTDKHLSILAENYLNVINKVTAAMPYINKQLVNDVRTDILVDKVARLEEDVAELKAKIA